MVHCRVYRNDNIVLRCRSQTDYQILDTKIKSDEIDYYKKWITTCNDYLWCLKIIWNPSLPAIIAAISTRIDAAMGSTYGLIMSYAYAALRPCPPEAGGSIAALPW